MKPQRSLLLLLYTAMTLHVVSAQPGVHQMLDMALPSTVTADGVPVLNPACIEKYYDTLVLPPLMPQSPRPSVYDDGCDDHGPHDEEAGKDCDRDCDKDCDKHGHRKLMHNKDGYGGKPGDHHHDDCHKHHHGHGKDVCCKGRSKKSDYYRISAREISQHVLPPGLPANVSTDSTCPGYMVNQTTRVYGYGTITKTGASTHNWPGFTIEARRNRPVKVTWANELLDLTNGLFRQHILKRSIDQTLHWANPAGLGVEGIDASPCMPCAMEGNCASNQNCSNAAYGAYEGPVPLVVHLHGNEKAYDFSDGYPEAWFMPAASNLDGYSPVGSWYDVFKKRAREELCDRWEAGTATFTYKNSQNPTQLWYHDHVLGITRINVYAGLAGLYNLREVDIFKGPELPGLPWPPPGIGFPDSQVREIPLAIQDRAFDINSQLYYPVNDLNRTQVLPNGPVPPKWIPEFLGITLDGTPLDAGGVSAVSMVVNGKTWPKFSVAREPYRLRLLNGCNARTLIVYFAATVPTEGQLIVPERERLDMYVIGNEAGFFPSIVGPRRSLLLGPAERYDVIVDFSQLKEGVGPVYLLNEGPEVPYNGTNNGELLTPHTAQVMRFDVQPGNTGKTYAQDVQPLLAPALADRYKPVKYTNPVIKRKFTLIENGDNFGNVVALYLGQAENVGGTNVPVPKTWSDPVTTNAAENSVEDWELINLTVDAHPIHIHEVYFQVVSNQTVNVSMTANGNVTWTETNRPVGPVVNRESILSVPCDRPEDCRLQKDTILVAAGTSTTVRLKTDKKGLFPWHCHLLEHEDNEMMRPWCIGQPGYTNPKTGTDMCPGPPGIPPL